MGDFHTALLKHAFGALSDEPTSLAATGSPLKVAKVRPEQVAPPSESPVKSLAATTDAPATAAWAALPAHLMSLIAERLDPTDVLATREVCKAWRDCHEEQVTALAPRACDLIPTLSLLRNRFPGLRRLDTSRCSFDPRRPSQNSLSALEGHLRLERLTLPCGLPLRRSILAPLPLLPRLRHVSLKEAKAATEAALAPLTRCSSLESLDLRGAYLSDAFLSRLVSQLPGSLKELRLGSCLLASPVIEAIAEHHRSLEVLELQWCVDLTGAPLQLLPATLTELTVQQGATVDEAACDALMRLTNLASLNLVECTWAPGVEDALHRMAVCLPSLRSLDLSGCQAVTDGFLSGLALFGSANTLEELRICGCWEPTDLGMAALSSMPGLKCLDVSDCVEVTMYGLGALLHPNGGAPSAAFRPPACPTVECTRADRAPKSQRCQQHRWHILTGKAAAGHMNEPAQPCMAWRSLPPRLHGPLIHS
eukprot:CAMPEP_0117655096 /NCGR_PEP_ID=MMETSP0804-20121206/4098_1 /TAXON_ID=1074897 /ORGANISM="Tetraselmis astigmatica, Strain CCMP880" /LENGTH=478 /DNA_ID=CAMNT_0005461427 /DNA_START=1 /DNA_END=1438 /DNA_ORIENTATION=+